MILLHLVRLYRRIRAHRWVGILGVFVLVLVCILGNAVCFLLFDGALVSEDGSEPQLNFGDALWYSVVSITTIGYGDHSAKSLGARLGTFLFIMVLGLATFSVCLGMGIEWVTDLIVRGQRGMTNIIAKDHILIVNFPSTQRINQLIDELKADAHYRGREIVIISDEMETLPISREQVLFVHGSILDRETYLRAGIETAQKVIVLATSYTDPRSDALVASVVAVINSINSGTDMVAECLDPQHRMLFDSVQCDSVVCSLQITGNLLVQEIQDRGVSHLVEMITSNRTGTTLYSTEVDTPTNPFPYSELAKRLLDRDINVVSVLRGKEAYTSFLSLQPQKEDRVIYAASERFHWAGMLEIANLQGS